MKKKRLFEEFPPVSSEEWKAKVMADLNGTDYDKKLVWKTEEGFDVHPYYRSEDLDASAASVNQQQPVSSGQGDPEAKNGAGKLESDALSGKKEDASREEDALRAGTISRDWRIRQDFAAGPSPEALNGKIRTAISHGAQSVGIDMSELNGGSQEHLTTLLTDINLAETELNFLNVSQPLQLLNTLSELAASTGTDPASIHGSVGFDPIKKLNAEGELNEQAFDELSDCLKTAAAKLPGIKMVTVDAGVLQDSGSTLSQELGFGLAMANAYLDKLTERGHTPGKIAATMLFSFSTGPNYFMEIAKLRAARWLWRAVCKEWGVEENQSDMVIHSRTASWNLTLYDPYVNMLRTTTETMSASLGGSDTITVHPFDRTFREENDFSSRIARNTQLLLKEEAYFNKVADPAAGSYYIEQLTNSIAEQAWKHFLETEEQGGYIEAFKKGWIREQVTASMEVKRSKASSGRTSILGVNKYPAFAEMILNQGVSVPGKKTHERTTYQPLQFFRIAEEIEQLRMQTEKSKKRPKVFLLKYGEPAWMTARGMFAGSFFACAGYKIVDNRGFETVEEGIAAAKKAKASIVVLCSADAAYPETAPAVHEAMKGSAEIVIAGYPKDSIEKLRQQGLSHFIHLKSNLLEELQKFQSLLNINQA
ncbi:MAG: methylmalonyl-CoA mutase family protein [Bacteroidales bacterium]